MRKPNYIRPGNFAINFNQGVLRSKEYDDIYFSTENGLEETRHVFLNGNLENMKWLKSVGCPFNEWTVASAALCGNLEGSIPGNTTNEPNLKMIKNPTVVRIRDLNSSIEKIFLITENNLIID